MKRGDPEYRAYVSAIVDSLPPLTTEDCERLAPLLRPGVLAVRKAIREREAVARTGAKTVERPAVPRPAGPAAPRPSRTVARPARAETP